MTVLDIPRRLVPRQRATAVVVARPAVADWRRIVQVSAAILSFLALFLVAFALGFSRLQEHSSQQRLFAQFRQQLAEGTAPVGLARPASPVAVLTIPRLDLRAVVVEGTDGAIMRLGPGHRRDTALPGQAGVSLVYGRAVSFGGPFAHLDKLRPGDTIRSASGAGEATYDVIDVRHAGDLLPPPVQAGGGRLVLAGLSGARAANVFVPDGVTYVDATLATKPAPAGPAAGIVSGSERMSATDTSALPMLVLWLQLLLIAVVVTVWAGMRWGLWQAWIAGVPALLALLWAASSSAAALLPNVY